MTDFDTALRARLQRLDAAVPDVGAPREATSLRGTPGRRRQLVLILAATAVLALGAALATAGSQPPVSPQEQARLNALDESVNRALLVAFPDEECVSRDEATRRIRAILGQVGLGEWQVREDATVAGARCMTVGSVAGLQAVLLVGRIDPHVLSALEPLRERFVEGCVDRSQANGLVAAAMAEVGFMEFVVSADPWGPKGAPDGQWEAYQQHVANGCFVYVSTQIARDGSGRLVVYLWGPWP